MQEPKTWYKLLGQLVNTPQAKQRLANQLNVSVVTVTRWISHTSNPRSNMLNVIINAFPEHREEFLALLGQEQITLQDNNDASLSAEADIPSADFYMHLLSVYRQISPTLRSATIQQLVLTDAIEHLDAQQSGIACALLLCLPPLQDNPVRSLYVAEGKGTSPWPQDLRQACNLLGAESLAGAVTMAGRPLLIDREDNLSHMIPSRWSQYERSVLAAPIVRGLQVAGCFLVSSTRPGSFLASQQQRIVCYADLFSLAIESEQWYAHERMYLQLMPPKEMQLPYFTHLPQQIIARMTQEGSGNYATMKLRIMQEIEGTLLQSRELSWPKESADPKLH